MSEKIERLTEECEYWFEAYQKGMAREFKHLKEIERLNKQLERRLFYKGLTIFLLFSIAVCTLYSF